jgi:chaperonin GroES
MITVLNDRVLIKKIEAEDKTAGGLFIASTAIEKKFEGIVIAVGPGKPIEDRTPIPLTVKIGDRVLYSPTAGIAVKIKEENYLTLREDDIFAVIEE